MNETERIGVFGGTFDPIHNAHIGIARAALHQATLDRVLFVVAARPPHKLDATVASPDDRYAMVEAALSSEPRMFPSRIELDREGPSFTADTLATLHEQHPKASLFLIIGLDSLMDMQKWRTPGAILSRARLLVVPRPWRGSISKELDGHYDMLDFEESKISSTQIREQIHNGESVEDKVPAAALQLIRDRGIYGAVASRR